MLYLRLPTSLTDRTWFIFTLTCWWKLPTRKVIHICLVTFFCSCLNHVLHLTNGTRSGTHRTSDKSYRLRRFQSLCRRRRHTDYFRWWFKNLIPNSELQSAIPISNWMWICTMLFDFISRTMSATAHDWRRCGYLDCVSKLLFFHDRRGYWIKIAAPTAAAAATALAAFSPEAISY